jgi:hypothetical protein
MVLSFGEVGLRLDIGSFGVVRSVLCPSLPLLHPFRAAEGRAPMTLPQPTYQRTRCERHAMEEQCPVLRMPQLPS